MNCAASQNFRVERRVGYISNYSSNYLLRSMETPEYCVLQMSVSSHDIGVVDSRLTTLSFLSHRPYETFLQIYHGSSCLEM